MAKTFIKKKSLPNQSGPGYRTPDHFKGSIFSGGKSRFGNSSRTGFNPGLFKTQHKG